MKKLQLVMYYKDFESLPRATVLPADTYEEAEQKLGIVFRGKLVIVAMEHITLPIGTSIAVKNDGGVYVTLKETEK